MKDNSSYAGSKGPESSPPALDPGAALTLPGPAVPIIGISTELTPAQHTALARRREEAEADEDRAGRALEVARVEAQNAQAALNDYSHQAPVEGEQLLRQAGEDSRCGNPRCQRPLPAPAPREESEDGLSPTRVRCCSPTCAETLANLGNATCDNVFALDNRSTAATERVHTALATLEEAAGLPKYLCLDPATLRAECMAARDAWEAALTRRRAAEARWPELEQAHAGDSALRDQLRRLEEECEQMDKEEVQPTLRAYETAMAAGAPARTRYWWSRHREATAKLTAKKMQALELRDGGLRAAREQCARAEQAVRAAELAYLRAERGWREMLRTLEMLPSKVCSFCQLPILTDTLWCDDPRCRKSYRTLPTDVDWPGQCAWCRRYFLYYPGGPGAPRDRTLEYCSPECALTDPTFDVSTINWAQVRRNTLPMPATPGARRRFMERLVNEAMRTPASPGAGPADPAVDLDGLQNLLRQLARKHPDWTPSALLAALRKEGFPFTSAKHLAGALGQLGLVADPQKVAGKTKRLYPLADLLLEG